MTATDGSAARDVYVTVTLMTLISSRTAVQCWVVIITEKYRNLQESIEKKLNYRKLNLILTLTLTLILIVSPNP